MSTSQYLNCVCRGKLYFSYFISKQRLWLLVRITQCHSGQDFAPVFVFWLRYGVSQYTRSKYVCMFQRLAKESALQSKMVFVKVDVDEASVGIKRRFSSICS